MIDFFRQLLESEQFMPRWVCGQWTPFHGWMYVISDLTIFLAYMAIPFALVYFVRKRWYDLPFKWVFYMFIAFITLCGLTHLIDAVIFWIPVYRLNAITLMTTAVVSVVTVLGMLKVIPQALTLKGPGELQLIVDQKTLELENQKLELKEANERLRSENEERARSQRELARLASIVQSSEDSIISLDLDGNITTWNPASERLYGYAEQEILGENMKQLYHEDDIGELNDVMRELTVGNTIEHLETRRVRKDGKLVHVSITKSPIFDSDGKVVGISGIARDIGEKRKAQLEQKRLLRELKRTNKELENFAYIASHDLKAPLRAIGSLADWIYADYADKMEEEGREHLNLLKARVQRMHDLIEGILHYSRVGRKDGELVELDLNKVVNDVIGLIEVPKNVSINVADGLPTVKMHKTHPTQIFENLISNAIKYGNEESGVVEVGFEELPDQHRFFVKDNGVGIDEKYHEKVFEIFQTLNARDEFESTGIGLTIVKKIIENAGGEIWLESEPDKGTTFYFTIPKS